MFEEEVDWEAQPWSSEKFVNLDHPSLEDDARPKEAELFHRNSLVLLAGAPKSGKTTMALALASAMVNGEKFGGIQVPEASVVYVSYDDSPAEIVAAAKLHPGLAKSKRFFLNYNHEPIDSRRGVEGIEIFMYRHRPVVVIIDSLHAALRSSRVDDPRKVRELLLPIHRMAMRSGTVILLHHTDKFARHIADHTQLQAAVSHTIMHTAKDVRMGDRSQRVITWKSAGRDLGVPRTYEFESPDPAVYLARNRELRLHGNDTMTFPILRLLESGPKSLDQVVDATGFERDAVRRKLRKLVLTARISVVEHLGLVRYRLDGV